MFSETEQKAIQEKLEQLQRVKEGELTPQELADLIAQRRVGWIQENLDDMLVKYEGLSPEEQAYRIVFFDHMQINPEYSKIVRVSPRKIRIASYNFCPYLEACRELDLETRFVCKDIGELSIQRMMEVINPNLRFSRNYANIRPYNGAFCEEYVELLSRRQKR
ncbi:MAG: hypothetical protein HZB66_00285 [Candidatus Aenigmarchaeota archaeon]|nr:hypothetical protein [Candidatus Aenigmarchaeota archaeon]